ncbi:MAG: hypothetical protein ACXVXI_00430 [Mycobacteriaceae bacterium]
MTELSVHTSALTQPFADAIAEAEKIIGEAPHITCEQDLIEGYEYLAGSIRASMQFAFAYERDFPYFVQSTGPYMKMGLDNPDTLYYSANLRDDAEYVVSGVRGSTADLSFQVLNGDYTPSEVPDSMAAFDDRAIQINPDGSYELRFGPPRADAGPNYFPLGARSSQIVVREVFSDWNTEQQGHIRIQRVDRIGAAPVPPTAKLVTKRYDAAAKMLLSRIRTFLAFPEWFFRGQALNTMNEPRLTPGGLASQYSSAGRYELPDGQVMVVTVPASDAPYQGIQLGSNWYVSLDYINHQTSLTVDQANVDPDGKIRFVVSERDPGLANWLEQTGHTRGIVQIRWQRVSRELGAADGPEVEVMGFDELPRRLPFYEQSTRNAADYTARIAARQVAVANRMLS